MVWSKYDDRLDSLGSSDDGKILANAIHVYSFEVISVYHKTIHHLWKQH